MRQSVSFSASDIESTSSNFTELRRKGIAYIQDLSGDIWTDYNSHDPGVTILEQLCYAMTDLAYRTSLPVNDLLTPAKGSPLNAETNAFFAPAGILSMHPVTIADMRKIIIDGFDEVQNAWIETNDNDGYQEELRGVNSVEILPNTNFLHAVESNPGKKDSFLKKIAAFLSENRNIGETFLPPKILGPQLINIDFDLYLKDQVDTESVIANVFLRLFEFIYTPIEYFSFDELLEEGLTLEQIYAGPRVTKGFMKDQSLGDRQKTIHADELQKLFSKVSNIQKCEVRQIISGGKSYTSLTAEPDKFFHLDVENSGRNASESRMESIYSNLNVFVNNKKLPSINKKLINNLFFELWSKKYRGFPMGQSDDDYFHQKLRGTYRNPNDYFSIQRHFPIIYGIGEEGLSSHEPDERKAKALQLKAYLTLFEQHLANHLSQLGNLNEFFNIDYKNGAGRTYFSQSLSSVPDLKKLTDAGNQAIENVLESEEVYFDRKNRIYDHLLARFGENFNDTPWRVALRLNMIKSTDEFNRIILQQKSEFLMHLETLSYNRAKGESFQTGASETVRIPSGLEQIISLKTGIPVRGADSLIPDFTASQAHFVKYREEPVKDIEQLNQTYRPVRADELNQNGETEPDKLPDAVFGKIGLKALFRETVNYKNYWLSIPKSTNDPVHVIFQKEPNTWVSLFQSDSEITAAQNISRIIDYFTEKNRQSESFFVIDHILLNDFLEGSTFGFCFLDEYGDPLFQTVDDESWCASEEDRTARLQEFYSLAGLAGSWSQKNGAWQITGSDKQIIAAYKNPGTDQQTQDVAFDDLFSRTKNLVKLFGSAPNENGRLRFEEVEKIRLMGTMSLKTKNFNQRRLVFQRKLVSGEIVSEDFFNLNISVVLPNWPARFQDERFQDYLTDLIYERMPAHLSSAILWIDAVEFRTFEEQYFRWESLKSAADRSAPPAENLKSAAFDVYRKIVELKSKTV